MLILNKEVVMKHIIKYLARGFSLLLLGGCTATMIIEPGKNKNSAYAPVNENSRYGLIKYYFSVFDYANQARREDAYKQMYEVCGGKYKIITEEVKSEGGTAMPLGDRTIYHDSQYIYIEFECVRQ